jgi:hypothetical protein
MGNSVTVRLRSILSRTVVIPVGIIILLVVIVSGPV